MFISKNLLYSQVKTQQKVKMFVISDKGIEILKKLEGLRLNSYLDSAGVWTIGYGHIKTAKKNQTITEAQAETLLKQDLIRFEKYVNSFNIDTQNQYDALVNFAFNIGSFGVNFTNHLKNKDLANLFLYWLKYVNAGGNPLLGLKRRRAVEIALFCDNSNALQFRSYDDVTIDKEINKIINDYLKKK